MAVSMSGLEAGKAALEKGTTIIIITMIIVTICIMLITIMMIWEHRTPAAGNESQLRAPVLTATPRARVCVDAGLILETDFERIKDAFVRGM